MKNQTTKILHIFISPNQGEDMVELNEVEVTLDGIKGDRYSTKSGFYSGKRIPDSDRGVSIISSIAIETANKELAKLGLSPFTFAQMRRNIVLDIDPGELVSLVHKKFKIGEVEFEGTEDCVPCRRPPELLNMPMEAQITFIRTFLKTGGLRAKVISGGLLRTGGILVYLA